MKDLQERLEEAILHFWGTRSSQAERQGSATGVKDAGSRSAVTGGKHLDGFVSLVESILVEGGIPKPTIFWENSVEVPGYFRATKKWDLLVVSEEKLIASIEFKAIVGSFGNNLNNRSEEAIGNAVDLLNAYREGAFKDSLKPWLGFLLIMLDNDKSTSPVAVREPHFSVLPEFRDCSYQERAVLLLKRLMHERLYDAACFLTSQQDTGSTTGAYKEPSSELVFRNFAESLLARAIAHAKMQGRS